MHQSALRRSLYDSSNVTSMCDGNQRVDKISSCFPLDFTFAEKTSLAFFLVFLGCVLMSSLANGFLFILTVRHRQLLWQPQYILMKNISVCGVGLSFITALAVFSSIVRKQCQMFGCWCIAQFCILRCFFLTSQMTLALMAIERYIFICHGIHYLRMVNTSNIHIGMGLVWLVSGVVSFHGGFVLSQIRCGFQQQTSGLLCDAFTIKEHITFSQTEDLLVFGPPSIITTSCILAICYCYGCMYHAALRVSMALKCSNHRANRTVGFYFLMLLLQLAFNVSFVILTVMEKRKASFCRTFGSTITPLLIVIPSGINAAFLLTRNPQIKRLLRCARLSPVMEVLHQDRSGDATGECSCQVQQESEVGRENNNTTPVNLPGYISPSEC